MRWKCWISASVAQEMMLQRSSMPSACARSIFPSSTQTLLRGQEAGSERSAAPLIVSDRVVAEMPPCNERVRQVATFRLIRLLSNVAMSTCPGWSQKRKKNSFRGL
ncbi:hypothetical protein EYF80_044834 [Liparis tanakae]|uniref:Uncharacterized protein n=1 Tax=Liparis tanakae TaxID=230148 RepID=A0A4Z2FVP8_9TELE|nr:hypothetical protein EYF80_044834 [Liparis tanakae]